ncbi:MAG: DNA repair protein RecN [Gammaproteobacteria bacterium]|nr:DNA repair protein RecN [Gammaproteobacteria bacterium]
MLTNLHISNFAIIDELELELVSGLTAVTGETGAGKSIMLDAIQLILGDRADSDTVKRGSNKAEISASFTINSLSDVQSWMQDNDLDSDDECLIRRIVSNEGRSKAYINGKPTTLAILRELGEQLIDLHGQHEHQILLKKSSQRQLLDDFAHHNELLNKVKNTFQAWQSTQKELSELERSAAERSDRFDLLKFQVSELIELDLAEGEYQNLDKEQQKLGHADRLMSGCQTAIDKLYDDENSAYNKISHELSNTNELAAIDADLKPAVDGIQSALIDLQDAVETLRNYSGRLEVDPKHLQYVEQRLNIAIQLSRKHHVMPEQLVQHASGLTKELYNLEHADESIDNKRDELKHLEQDYLNHAQTLSASRKKSAETLNKKVSDIIETLGMNGGGLKIDIQHKSAEKKIAIDGIDNIEFLVRTNPGQDFRSLAKTASGGELSRLSLAIQVATANTIRMPTLVFDEVDSGIGGGTAEVVGKMLRQLGSDKQVLCVTHLPQVASQAHQHLQVNKIHLNETTNTNIIQLNDKQRTEEIARMLGGMKITEQTLSHAEEMLKQAH